MVREGATQWVITNSQSRYFNRDVECIRTFFRRRFQYESALYPRFRKTIQGGESGEDEGFRLDVAVAASGFGRKDMKALEEVGAFVYWGRSHIDHRYSQYMEAVGGDDDEVDQDDDDDVESEEEDSQDEEEEEDDSAHVKEAELVQEAIATPATSAELVVAASDGGGTETMTGDLSDQHQRSLSRSPPRSRAVSPASLQKMTAALDINGIRDIVSSDLTKVRARQQRKYHSKRGARHAGRPQGSKAKQDTRIKLDKSGVWE